MAPDRDNAVHSDAENGEKPVREQLKNARITQERAAVTSEPSNGEPMVEDNTSSVDDGTLKPQPRAELRRKRSYEEVDDANAHTAHSDPVRHHTRKRSRDSTAEEFELNNGRRKGSGERSRNSEDENEAEADSAKANGISKPPRPSTPDGPAEKQNDGMVEEVASPKNKRSRLHSSTEDEIAASKAENTGESTSNGTAKEVTTTKIPPTSGFANASATSPFGALAGGKSPAAEATSSSSAFAASGFSALSGSTTSGFGSIAKSGGGFGSGGSFGSGAKSPQSSTEAEPKPSSGGFGGALGQKSAFAGAGSTSLNSGFGSASSGFGRIGSPSAVGFGSGSGTGFGGLSSTIGGGGGLSSFASGKSAPAPLGGASKPTRAFGAPATEVDDDEGSNAGDEEEGIKSPLSTEEEKQDERFYAQSLETGEEDEVTAFSCRAKLYNFTFVGEGEKEGKKKEWRERGLGVLRLNVKDAGDGEKTKARLLMRADGSHRVVLNTPLTKDIKFGSPNGGPPQSGYIFFMGTIGEGGGLELLQVKMRQQNCLDLYEKVTELQESM
ncbi:unnamed protein product [Zymoseptoria tritici ST99CH_1A5]|uniref:RanBD1 domain-containing protein n=3 Tax=Zymoseptoria tritici TaxID=1047171 RepID=A0A1X7RW44_ZYMT9|nr:unnamed protein product [Zymoseptoria tritici ST99CH_3D7]SMR53070.1 unnamed protein product [Zymoseptoria tritici ST99CH_1E4]SMY24811.1 unnamed protein product [Zymoseptoria tritici ST99CH_1A5]